MWFQFFSDVPIKKKKILAKEILTYFIDLGSSPDILLTWLCFKYQWLSFGQRDLILYEQMGA